MSVIDAADHDMDRAAKHVAIAKGAQQWLDQIGHALKRHFYRPVGAFFFHNLSG
jgi:hypothetical protein